MNSKEQAFSNIAKAIGENYKIVGVKVLKNRNEIVLTLNGKILNIKEIEARQVKLSSLFGVKTVRFSFEGYTLEQQLLTLKDNWQMLKRKIFQAHPSYLDFLDQMELCIEGHEIKFYVENESYYNFIKQKHIIKTIGDAIQYYFDFQFTIGLELGGQKDKKVEKNTCNGESNEEKEKRIIHEVLNGKIGARIVASNPVIMGKSFKDAPVKIIDIREDAGTVAIEGKIFKFDERELNDNRYIFKYWISDNTNSITCKQFFRDEASFKEIKDKLKIDMWIKVKGAIVYDKFDKELMMEPRNIIPIEKEGRKDEAEVKRIELHAHTNMSTMDGICTAKKLVERASAWGHKAIAITDHGVVQAFPDAFETARKKNIKVIYGVEGYFADDGVPIVYHEHPYGLEDTIVVFDIETTGLNNKTEKITEIGAVKIKNGEIIDVFSRLINPEIPIPEKITKLTGITNDMVRNEETIAKVMPEFLEFIGDLPIVAHNAMFDYGFIQFNCSMLGYGVKNAVIDTLQMSRSLLPELKKHKLNLLCEHFGISLENHHRASDDATATAYLFYKLCELLKEKGITDLEQVNQASMAGDYKKLELNHMIILVKTQEGLKNLYRIISESHLNSYFKRPRILKSVLTKYRKGLIIGSACEAGEIFKCYLNKVNYNTIYQKASFYDYFEIQPDGNNNFLLKKNILNNVGELHDINKNIIALADKMKKPVVATGDVHFLEPEDEVYRRILMTGQGFDDANEQPPLYLKTTEEMLKEFYYLGEEKAKEVVITNTNLIADSIETIIPIPDGTFAPKIEGEEEQVRSMTMNKAYSIYGENLPPIVQARLDKELNSIIGNGYSVMYLIAQKLVKNSLEHGYLVGSRGSVGSSFVATMCDITEVNPLPPHYVCGTCQYSEFVTDGTAGTGIDLPEKSCPRCNETLIREGHDIPFEAFLGFDGDKEPDIDLNFAGEVQGDAHRYTEELFGKGYVFRAGTIGTLADKTAYGYVKGYFTDKDIQVSAAEIDRLVTGCTGIKRTTGQHPGGVMVVPNYTDIYEFTPIQRPADDTESDIITTHFDYHSISGRLLKLDILGHDVPSIIKMLENFTGHSVFKIRLNDERTMSLFSSSKEMNIDLSAIDCVQGCLGIPEFGTYFVRQMLLETNPTTFEELIRISGLSHGTDVWIGNAQEIIKSGKAVLKQVICTRDDIMLYLITKGVQPKMSFKIMENVRKGKGLTSEYEQAMKEKDVPDWYIESCKKIKYMFPRAHAAAYVMMSFRIAYYKLNYPQAFYATYFTIKLDDFDANLCVQGKMAILEKWKELSKLGNSAKGKEKGQMTVLEVVYEMYERGVNLQRVDLYKSEASKFILDEHGILPPLGSLQGLGVNAAQNIVEARKDHVFDTIEDLRLTAKLSKTVIEILREHGCLKDLPETSQFSLF